MYRARKLNEGFNMRLLREKLLKWSRSHYRRFPWRLTRSPYRILVSEVLLHRTQAAQVLPVYVKLTSRYPTMQNLSLATKEDMSGILRPLGLSWRTTLFFEMVQAIKV